MGGVGSRVVFCCFACCCSSRHVDVGDQIFLDNPGFFFEKAQCRFRAFGPLIVPAGGCLPLRQLPVRDVSHVRVLCPCDQTPRRRRTSLILANWPQPKASSGLWSKAAFSASGNLQEGSRPKFPCHYSVACVYYYPRPRPWFRLWSLCDVSNTLLATFCKCMH